MSWTLRGEVGAESYAWIEDDTGAAMQHEEITAGVQHEEIPAAMKRLEQHEDLSGGRILISLLCCGSIEFCRSDQ